MWQQLLFPVLSLGGISFIFGAGLSLASKKFEVETDSRVDLIREALPGANCGACGFPGCDGLAAAIVEGSAPIAACTVGGSPVAEKVGAIMGVNVEASEKKVARVLCQGDCDKATDKFKILSRLRGRSMLADGQGCSYGCLGLVHANVFVHLMLFMSMKSLLLWTERNALHVINVYLPEK